MVELVDTLDLKSNEHYVRGGSSPPLGTFARIAQLVEHDLAKVGVASSSLVSRSVQEKLHNLLWSFFYALFLNQIISNDLAKVGVVPMRRDFSLNEFKV